VTIYAEGRARGEEIKSGDRIGLNYHNKGSGKGSWMGSTGKGWWFSCGNNACTTRTCPGHASQYQGSGWRWPSSCDWEVFNIYVVGSSYGDDIEDGDTVALTWNHRQYLSNERSQRRYGVTEPRLRDGNNKGGQWIVKNFGHYLGYYNKNAFIGERGQY